MAGQLPLATKNSRLSTPERQVWFIDCVPISTEDEFELAFESNDPGWRHGVWLAVDGALEVDGSVSDQVVLWTDTAPAVVGMKVKSTADGLLRLYNVWDSGRGIRPWESQTATSGMIRESLPNAVRYSCNDISPDPTFDHLVFELRKRSALRPDNQRRVQRPPYASA